MELGPAWMVVEGRASQLERVQETRGLCGTLVCTHSSDIWLPVTQAPVTWTDCCCLILTLPDSLLCRTEFLTLWVRHLPGQARLCCCNK